ncbi:MAG: response regulator transcription factor [Chloroflexi bacterium]|nr:response regulator transcription factor [Chloroflexota bacterium]
MNRVLLVSANTSSTPAVLASLKGAGYDLLQVGALDEAIATFTQEAPEFVVVNLDAPNYSEIALRSFVNACKTEMKVPVFGLVREDQVAAINFRMGLDDFLLLPLRQAEVRLRIAAAQSKGRGPADSQKVMLFGDLAIDTERYEVTLAGHRVELTFKEYELLRYLASQPNRVFSRDQLLSKVWGYDYFGGTRTVDVHVRRLRSKIEDAAHIFIDTVRNVGYRFTPPAKQRQG